MVVKLSSEDIWQMLSEVKDPEIPLVTITGMGIVRDVLVTDHHVEVVITPTYSGCPAMKEINDSISQKLRENNIEDFTIKSVLSPPWTSDWITEEAREKLKESGITPPHKVPMNELLTLLRDERVVSCPYCNSEDTKKTSEFGSTLCKSLHFCNGCQQPFEYFKCIQASIRSAPQNLYKTANKDIPKLSERTRTSQKDNLMEYQHITYVVEDNVAIITLNRPDVLNSFHMEMAIELQKILDDVHNNNEVRCALLTGSGRAFCAGQDLAEATKNPEEEKILGDFVAQMYNPIVRGIRSTAKPIVCAVNGVAAGAGANLALACDIVFASDRASFIQSFCKIGLVPDTAGSFFLPRLVGFGRASALMLLGDKIGAQQALEMGMIYRVVENDCLLEEATETARYLATQPTKGLGYIKEALNRSLVNDLEAQLDTEKVLQTLAGQTQDYKEGVQAFLEKRKPKFTGNQSDRENSSRRSWQRNNGNGHCANCRNTGT